MANSGTKLHGKNGAIYLGGAKGSGGVKVATKSSWTLQRNRDYVDATVFGEANKTYLAGLPNVQGSFAGILDASGDLLLNAATSETQQMYLYADDNPFTTTSEVLVAHGPALIDASVDASNTDAVRITGEFRAQGSWTIDLGS
jgi:hypothetical protein